MSRETTPAIRTRLKRSPPRAPRRPARARPSGRPSPGRSRRAGRLPRQRHRACCVGRPARDGDAARAVEVAAGQLAHGDQRGDTLALGLRADLLVEGGRAGSPSSAMSPSTATRRRSPAVAARCFSAALIESGFALYASLIISPPPASGTSSPRQRENSTSTRCGRGRPSASSAASAAAGVGRVVLRREVEARRRRRRRGCGVLEPRAGVLAEADDLDVLALDAETRPARSPCHRAAAPRSARSWRAARRRASRPARGARARRSSRRPRSGRAIAQRSAIWPKPRIASSTMQTSVSGSSRQSVSGTPISLLKFASVATSRGRPASAARMSFVEVFPVEPGDADDAGARALAHRRAERGEGGEGLVRHEGRGGASLQRVVAGSRRRDRRRRRGRPRRSGASRPARR